MRMIYNIPTTVTPKLSKKIWIHPDNANKSFTFQRSVSHTTRTIIEKKQYGTPHYC